LATGAKSYSYGALTVGPDTPCSITYSHKVMDSASVDVTTALSSFISLTPTGDTTDTSFDIAVASSSDLTLAAASPYVVTVKAHLTASSTDSTTDTLTLTVKNACTGSLTATSKTLESDWTTLTGDTFF
jgi:hypothetical protein